MVHSAATLTRPRSRNLRASCCSLMIPEDRFDQLLSQPISFFGCWGGHPGAMATQHCVVRSAKLRPIVQALKAGHA